MNEDLIIGYLIGWGAALISFGLGYLFGRFNKKDKGYGHGKIT